MSRSRTSNRLPELLAHLSCAALVAMVLVAAGQPLFADDTWWHLVLGEAFAREGPRLGADPLLFTAPGPPAPAAWLFDVALFGIGHAAGFTGLRVTTALAVGAILVLAWTALRRASGSPLIASLATSGFAVLSAYRLVQLRPHLLSILAALVLYRLVIERGEEGAPASAGRVAAAIALMALWANLHAAFLLGPILLAAAIIGLVTVAPLRPRDARRRDHAQALRLAIVMVLGLIATLANPEGLEPHRAWFVAGDDTPSLGRVADEWQPVDPLQLPSLALPPSPLAWALYWGLLVATPLSGLVALRRWRRPGVGGSPEVDPALVAVAAASLVAPLVAVRFLWLTVFPLLLVARTIHTLPRPDAARAQAAAWGAAVLAALLVPGFARAGDWPFLSRAFAGYWPAYAKPYYASKYYGHSIWFLRDAGLEGNLFNDYFLGGYAGFWLAPELKAFANGTLNMRAEAIDANLPLRQRRGVLPDEDFLAALDRLEVDLYFGIHLPEASRGGRPHYYTTGHLEGTPGWIPVFRNLRGAVYLRRNARNAANLDRVAAYYADEGVPFDRERGFEPEQVVRENLRFAVRHGVVPGFFGQLGSGARAPDPVDRHAALSHLAATYAALGLYERALRTDERLLRIEPSDLGALRRRAWSLLRLARYDEAKEAGVVLEASEAADPLSAAIARVAREAARLAPEEAAGRVARLPVFTPYEAVQLRAGLLPPETRSYPR